LAHLVVGAEGLVGTALAARLRSEGHQVLETTRRPERVEEDKVLLDLAASPANWDIPAGITVAYLCAAVTNLESCRKDPVGTAKVNVEGTTALADHLLEQGAFVVAVSSNRVFDGTHPHYRTTDPFCPTTEYGRQKVALENRLGTLGSGVGICRLTKVLPPDYPLVLTWRRDLLAHQAIHPHQGVRIAPITLGDAATALSRIGELERPGLVQVSGDCDISYTEIATRLVAQLGADPGLVQPVDPASAGITPEHIAAYESLDTSTLKALGIPSPRSWEAVEGCLGA
jgi:dTDP-4-dehydrorhamnose reductase